MFTITLFQIFRYVHAARCRYFAADAIAAAFISRRRRFLHFALICCRCCRHYATRAAAMPC